MIGQMSAYRVAGIATDFSSAGPKQNLICPPPFVSYVKKNNNNNKNNCISRLGAPGGKQPHSSLMPRAGPEF